MDFFEDIGKFNCTIRQFDKNILKTEATVDDGAEFAGAVWKVIKEKKETDYGYLCTTVFTPDAPVDGISVTGGIEFSDWSREDYVLLPGAVYDGNRFDVAEDEHYPPSFLKENFGKILERPVITDIPKLATYGEDSDMELVIGDMSMPVAGVHFKNQKEGMLLITEQNTVFGENGINMKERGSGARIAVTVPCVKEKYQYIICRSKDIPSEYEGIHLDAGQSVTVSFKLYLFRSDSIQSLYDKLFSIRKTEWKPELPKNEVPFSEGFRAYENAVNSDLWQERRGYYRQEYALVNTTDEARSNWQTGWIGGGMMTLSLMSEGSELTVQRAVSTMDFFTTRMQAESGFYYSLIINGKVTGDNFKCPEDINFVLLRRNADALYFLLKHIEYLKLKGLEVNPNWVSSAEKCADAFCRLWKKYGEIGQFTDIEKEEIIIYGTSSAVMAIGALALAYKLFEKSEYIETAKEAAEYYYINYLAKGLTNGGPSEAMQAPDSESLFAFVESYTVLYEITKDKIYLKYAEEAAAQFASWVMPYNFEFPDYSEFCRLGICTIGSVFANVQNKHSAPGICTMSGDSLIKLFRFTGDEKYIELASDIAHNIVQYYSRDDKPIYDKNGIKLPDGYMCERVNTSDWEYKRSIGGVFAAFNWCANAGGLTYAEIPGIYVRTDLGKLWIIDHVEATLSGNMLEIFNPCEYTAKIKVLSEADSTLYTDISAAADFKYVELKPKERIKIKL